MTQTDTPSVSLSNMHRPSAHYEMLQVPPFIVGSQRSGTTLLRLMLSHHPQLAFMHEFEWSVECMGADGSFPALSDYYDYLSTHRTFLSSECTIDQNLSYTQLLNSFLCQRRDAEGKSIVGATCHFHYNRLLAIWPDARFIHIVRDGRDIARSSIDMGWNGNVWTGVQRWIDAETLWDDFSKRLPPERHVTVTYETLVRRPQETLEKLCTFLGLPYDDAMLDYSKNSTYEAPNPKFLEQWRRKLSEHEIQLIESRVRQLLLARGYELSGLPSLQVTPAMQRKLLWSDRVGRAKARVKRYGLPLFAADFFARRIGTQSMRKAVKIRINDIDVKHLK